MLKRIVFFILLIMVFDLAFASILVKVKSVHDGDTLTFSYLSDETTTFKGRLANIDAPELKQSYGTNSKDYLTKLISNSQNYVNVDISGKDIYNRNLITVYDRNGLNLNQELVKSGFAWAYDRKYRELEQLAKINHHGLWSEANPIRPSDWRKLNKNNTKSIIPGCTLKTCTTIKTCDEANQLLHDCNLQSLDGNNNGIPCEMVCKPTK